MPVKSGLGRGLYDHGYPSEGSLFGQQSGGGLPAVSRAPRGRQWEWLPMLPPQAGPPRDAHPSVGAAETPVPGLGGLILFNLLPIAYYYLKLPSLLLSYLLILCLLPQI